MDFATIYFNDIFDVNSIDIWVLNELFPTIEISLGAGQYVNVYTIDRSLVDSIADELGRSNVVEIAYS